MVTMKTPVQYNETMLNVTEFIGKFNSGCPELAGESAELRFNEPLAGHTTFRVGGPADLWIRPAASVFPGYAVALRNTARREGMPVFVLGGGANLVVADAGIRGIVLDLGGWTGLLEPGFSEPPGRAVIPGRAAGSSSLDGTRILAFRSGTPVDEAVEAAAARGLSGLEFLAGMPGTIGGAIWMNARAYDRDTADVLVSAAALWNGPEPPPNVWDYKKSPFQGTEALILEGTFALRERPKGEIYTKMEAHRRDREAKGHYRYPSAGSVFKNNRDFGAPTGKIIDELGLRGFALGGAQVAPWHGNIIINRGGAQAADIRALTEELKKRVRDERGLELECEIIFAGDW